MLAVVWIQMLICLTCERPLIVPTVVLCIQIRQWKWLRHKEIQTNPTHHCKMSLFIGAQALHALDRKWKAILHMPGDVVKCSQWDLTYEEPQFRNKQWLGRVLLSWINIRGQTDLVDTQLLTFIEMHWMVVCIKQWILRRDSVTREEIIRRQ